MERETVDAAYVLANRESLPLVDVRPAEMYAAGHIPGAINIDLVAIQNEVGAEESPEGADLLAQQFQKAGIGPDDGVIVYCQMGAHAAMACDLLETKGYSSLRYYKGSFADWSSNPTRPVER